MGLGKLGQALTVVEFQVSIRIAKIELPFVDSTTLSGRVYFRVHFSNFGEAQTDHSLKIPGLS